MAHANPTQCWVLAEESFPHTIIDASPLWLATWKYEGEEVIGIKSPDVLNGAGHDTEAGKLLMNEFRTAGILIEHTVCMMRAMGGILAVSTDLSEAPSVAPAQQSSLRNIGASIAAEMNAKRQGQAPGRTDELKARIDQIDEITEGMDEIGETLELVSSLEATMSDEEVDEAPDTFYGDEHLEVTEGPEAQKTPTAEPLEAVQPEVAVAKKVSEGSTSYDSTMTQYLDDEASLASAAIPEVDSN